MIKQLITDGCSFSTPNPYGWPLSLFDFLKSQNPDLTFVCTAMSGHGNGLIQKRTMLNVVEALNSGLAPEEILVVVMWSGNSRSSWYIDNPNMTKLFNFPTNHRVLMDLKNIRTPKGGWHSTEHGSHEIDEKLKITQLYHMLDEFPNGVGKMHDSLENMIMLQNFCKLKGVTLIQQYYMDMVFEDIERLADHQIINYLYEQLDFDNIIKQGMLEYIESFLNIKKPIDRDIDFNDRINAQNGIDLFHKDGFHPGPDGVKLWCENKLFPFIKNKI